MNTRQKRLNEAFDYARKHFGVHTKTQFAKEVGFGRSSMSSALNGNEEYLTDNLFKLIHDRYKESFNLDYLLTGEGSLITIEEEVRAADAQKMAVNSSAEEQTASVLELYARMIRSLDDLRQELKAEIEETRAAKSEIISATNELRQARDDFRDATYRITQFIKNQNFVPSPFLDIAAESSAEPSPK